MPDNLDPKLKSSLDQLEVEQKKKRRRGCRRVLLILLVIVLVLCGFGYLLFFSSWAFPGTGLKGELSGQINILVLGRGGEGHSGADLTDTNMLVMIRPAEKRVGMLSIPRDLWVTTPKYGESKLNAVYAEAKNSGQSDEAAINLVKQHVTDITGIKPDYYALIDFTGMEEVVDTLGGIDVYVDTAFTDTLHHIHYPKGVSHFDGQAAVMYSRARYADNGEGTDFQRADRQQDLLVAIKDKALSSEVLLNPSKLSALSQQYKKHVLTDISLRELSRLRVLAGSLSDEKTIKAVYSTSNVLVAGHSVDGTYILKPRSGDWSETKAFAQNLFKDKPSVMILNGTKEAGRAEQAAKELLADGYNVLGWRNADRQTYIQTLIYDNRQGQYQKTGRTLADRFHGTVADDSYSDQRADLVVIIGQGEQKVSFFKKLFASLSKTITR